MTRWVVIALVVSMVPFDAFAELSDAERQADEAFQRGVRLYEAEDYLAAAHEFEHAYQIVPIQSVHYNIARSYELAEIPALAAQHYRAFIDARAGNPERRQEVRQRLERLSEGLSWVRVQTNPDRATLLVDGDERGISPTVLAVTPGRHTIEARLDDRRASRTVEAGANEAEITLSLRDEASEPVTFSNDTQTSVSRTAGATTEPTPTNPEPEVRHSIRRLHHGVFWAGLGLTIASGVALAVVGTQLIDKREEYHNLLGEDPREVELREQGEQLEVATTVLWVTTGVLAGATLIFAIFTNWRALRRHRSDEEGARIRWRVGLGPSFTLNF